MPIKRYSYNLGAPMRQTTVFFFFSFSRFPLSLNLKSNGCCSSSSRSVTVLPHASSLGRCPGLSSPATLWPVPAHPRRRRHTASPAQARLCLTRAASVRKSPQPAPVNPFPTLPRRRHSKPRRPCLRWGPGFALLATSRMAMLSFLAKSTDRSDDSYAPE